MVRKHLRAVGEEAIGTASSFSSMHRFMEWRKSSSLPQHIVSRLLCSAPFHLFQLLHSSFQMALFNLSFNSLPELCRTTTQELAIEVAQPKSIYASYWNPILSMWDIICNGIVTFYRPPQPETPRHVCFAWANTAILASPRVAGRHSGWL